MILDLQQLRTFVAIADAGGVTKAAERLHLSQPAVSRQIQALETALGIALFVRVGRRVRLTSAGEDLLAHSRRVLAGAQALRQRARALQGGDAGVVRIGATPPMIEAILVRFLPGYRVRHPGVDVHVIEDGGASLITRLERAEVDVAYVPAGQDRLVGRLLYPIHVVAAVPRRHALGRHREVEVTSLTAWPLLALRRGFGSREWFESACLAANVRPNILLDSGAHNVVLGLTQAGYGVGVLPSAVPLNQQGIRLLPIVHRGAPIGRWTMLAWEPDRPLAPYANQFVDEFVLFARQHYPGRSLVRRVPIPPPMAGPRPRARP
ncbi:MAG: LysR family transcriptional regulator [Hyphomicrobiaceae bacterium]